MVYTFRKQYMDRQRHNEDTDGQAGRQVDGPCGRLSVGAVWPVLLDFSFFRAQQN